MTQIRVMQPQDAEAVRALGARLREGVAPWREAAAVGATVSGWVDEALAHAFDPGRVLFVAAHGGAVVGFVTVSTRAHWSGGREAYIGELVVAKAHEGAGIGSRLLDAAERWAIQQGHSRLTLETGAANTRARAFYDRHGYRMEDVVLSRALI